MLVKGLHGRIGTAAEEWGKPWIGSKIEVYCWGDGGESEPAGKGVHREL